MQDRKLGGSRLRSLVMGLVALAPMMASSQDLTNGIIVKYRDQPSGVVTQAAQMRGAQASGVRFGIGLSRARVTALKSHVYKFDRQVSLDEARRLARDIAANDPNVEYAEPDTIAQHTMVPNDTDYHVQWPLRENFAGINVERAWDMVNGSNVIVAVIDTGYRPHRDLAGNLLPGYDFVSDIFRANDGNGRDEDPLDPGDAINPGECTNGFPGNFMPSTWHGTHVAGTIAALTNNTSGVAGVAFGARVVPVRVLGRCGGTSSDIADAIVWAAGGAVAGTSPNLNPAHVINMSLRGPGACSQTYQSAIDFARSRGVTVVVSAGNDNFDASNVMPASCQGVITVASVNRIGEKAWYSNFGPLVEIAAPGGDLSLSAVHGVYSTFNAGVTGPEQDAYTYSQGTSMAAPHVAGVVALMLSAQPSLTHEEILQILQSTSRAFPGICSQCGSGIVDASAAINRILPGPLAVTLPTPTGPVVFEVEPNNTRVSAHFIVSNDVTVRGQIQNEGDADFFQIRIPAGRSFDVTLAPNSGANYDLFVYDGNGNFVGGSAYPTGVVDGLGLSNTGTTRVTRVLKVFYSGGGSGSGAAGAYLLHLKLRP